MTTITTETANDSALSSITLSDLAGVRGGGGGNNGNGNNGNGDNGVIPPNMKLACPAGTAPNFTYATGSAGVQAAGGNVNVNATGTYENFHCDVLPQPMVPSQQTIDAKNSLH